VQLWLSGEEPVWLPATLAHVDVSLGKALNPNISSVAVPVYSVWMCMNVSNCWCAGGTLTPPIRVRMSVNGVNDVM